MTRSFLVLAVLLAVGTVTRLQAEPPKKAPPSVTKIVDKAVTAVRNNRKPYDEANKKVLAENEKALNEELDRLTKAGKLDEAIATREILKSFKETVLKQADAPIEVKVTEAPKKPLLERMAGKWDLTPDPRHYRLYANGTAEFVRDNDGAVENRGRITVLSPDVAEVKWSNGWTDHFHISGDDAVAVFQWNPDGTRQGDGLAIERMK